MIKEYIKLKKVESLPISSEQEFYMIDETTDSDEEE